MIFNDHSKLEGKHAFLGASNFRWINYNEETLEQRYYNQFSQSIGTHIHDLAKDLIDSRTRLSKTDKKIIDLYLYKQGIPKNAYRSELILMNLLPFVNDAIGYRMSSEIILFYSYNAFGTADAISYDEKNRILRIHDLKTGKTPTHIEQLLIYAALFFLEYRKKPEHTKVELRIYQNVEDENGVIMPRVLEHFPDYTEIEKFMFLITTRNDIVKKYIERDYRG